jgi:putative DNA primase/helicase
VTTREAINAAVKEAYDAGLCVVPPREDGSKRPEGFWKQHITTRPSLDQLRELYQYERHGLGVVCGSVSGELEVLDFDDRDTYQRFKAAAALAGLEELVERIESSYLEESPRGVHWLWRTDKAGGNTKLAMRQTGSDLFVTLMETRGGGGFCILSPSYGVIHPEGAAYIRVTGSFSTIPFVDQRDRDALLEVARKLDECEKHEEVRILAPAQSPAGGRPGDDFEARADWHEDVLLPAGWTKVAGSGHQEYWRRPGKDDGHSAVLHLDSGYFVPFSSSTPFPETEVGYGKFRVYVYLFHQGDYQAAARALRRAGYGAEPEPVAPEAQAPSEGLFVPISMVRSLEFTEIPTLPVLRREGFVSEGGINLMYSFPKTGKTELLAALAVEWADMGKRVLYLT